jgi:GT2 family glycosyltransferase
MNAVATSVDVIIVNWNAGQQLRDCLASIVATQRHSFEIRRIVVVDNASWDESALGLDDLALPLTVLYNATNRGFAAACNQGAQGSTADYLLFLNPDTRLSASSLVPPLAFMECLKSQSTGIIGIQLLDNNGQVSRSCARFPTPGRLFARSLGLDRLFPRFFPSCTMTEWDHKESRVVDQVIGAFFLVRRPLFETLRGFDERFFVYMEEVDFSLRAMQMGWKSVYLTEAQAYHKGGGTSEQVKAARLFYAIRSRILYAYKHFRWTVATGLLLTALILEPVARIAFAIMKGSLVEVWDTLKGYIMLWSNFPEWFHRCIVHNLDNVTHTER